jgi:glutamate racemase
MILKEIAMRAAMYSIQGNKEIDYESAKCEFDYIADVENLPWAAEKEEKAIKDACEAVNKFFKAYIDGSE